MQARIKDDSFSLKERVVAYENLSSVGAALARIHNGSLDASMFPDAFSKGYLADVVRILDQNDDLPWWKKESQEYPRKQKAILSAGIVPNSIEPERASLEKSLESAKRSRRDVQRALGEVVDPIERTQKTLSSIAGSKNTRVPIDGDGRSHASFTIRSIPPGNQFAPHTGNFSYAAAYDALRDPLDTTEQIHFFTPLCKAEPGRERETLSLRWRDQKTSLKHNKILSKVMEAKLSSSLSDLDEGEMIVFDGGRFYRHVNPVSDHRHRFRLGALAALSDMQEEVLCWG